MTHSLATILTIVAVSGYGMAQEPSAYMEQGNVQKRPNTVMLIPIDQLLPAYFGDYGKCYCEPGWSEEATALAIAVDPSDPSGNTVLGFVTATTPGEQMIAVAKIWVDNFGNGVPSVAAGDVNGDGVDDIITGFSPATFAAYTSGWDWDIVRYLDTMEEGECGL